MDEGVMPIRNRRGLRTGAVSFIERIEPAARLVAKSCDSTILHKELYIVSNANKYD